MDKCREAFETWFRTTKAYQMLEDQNYFKMDIFHFVDGRNEYRHTFVQIAFMTWQSRQAEINQLQSQINEMAEVGLSQESVIRGKDKRIEELTHLATELAEYTSYAEIVGAISHNRQPIREFCDKIFDFNRKIEEEALRGEHE